jgi:NitT/TauT family transport system ATP-binding protein
MRTPGWATHPRKRADPTATMPTTYPKSTPTEMMGLLVLLKDHHGEQDLARLADDLDLEIDEILPATDFAEALQLVKVTEGRLKFTEMGLKLANASIRERKTLLREQLLGTTLFRTLVRALEAAPEGQLSDEEVNRLIGFVVAPADEAVLNIINWGRYAEIFRYDPEARVLTLVRHRPARSSPPGSRIPPTGGPTTTPPASRSVPSVPGSDKPTTQTVAVRA